MNGEKKRKKWEFFQDEWWEVFQDEWNNIQYIPGFIAIHFLSSYMMTYFF